MQTLPTFQGISSDIPACPTAGGGVHRWLLSAANHCRLRGMSENATADHLHNNSRHCGRRVSDHEIADAVRRSFASTWTSSGGNKPAPKWPAPAKRKPFNLDLGLADLWELSPVRFDDDASYTEHVVDALFPGNPLLCVGRTSWNFQTRHREDLRGQLSGLQLIVPSTMTKQIGITKDGDASEHCLDNTGPRRFAIIECDEGSPDEQAALLWHLATMAPLSLVVLSGGKSVHGWFFVEGEADDPVRRFYRYAVKLGADSATHTRCQFVRMPDGTRDNGRRQSVIYFNPEALQ